MQSDKTNKQTKKQTAIAGYLIKQSVTTFCFLPPSHSKAVNIWNGFHWDPTWCQVTLSPGILEEIWCWCQSVSTGPPLRSSLSPGLNGFQLSSTPSVCCLLHLFKENMALFDIPVDLPMRFLLDVNVTTVNVRVIMAHWHLHESGMKAQNLRQVPLVGGRWGLSK